MSEQKLSPQNITTIIVTIITVIGTIVGGYFVYRGTVEPRELEISAAQTEKALQVAQTEIALQATQTEIANQAAQPSIQTPSSIQTAIPVENGTSQPISTSPITHTPTIEILFQEDFIDNRNQWLEQNNSKIESIIIGGKYKHTIKCPSSSPGDYCNFHIEVPKVSIRDFQLEVDIAITKQPPYSKAYIGIEFRRTRQYFYYIFYYDNEISMNLTEGNNIYELMKDAIAPNYDLSNGAINRNGFIANGNQFEPLVNNEVIFKVEDGKLNQNGEIFFVLHAPEGSTTIFELDNLIISAITE